MSRSLSIVLSLLLALIAASTFGQDGVSTAGEARTHYLGVKGVLPAAREVVVEDFINYHRHEIARPKAGQSVALDLRWEKESVPNGGEAVLQVGLSTSLAHDRSELRPLNLSVVIDKSGSMAQEDKLVRVKQSLLDLVDQLRPTDVLSIVVFDSEAQVLLPAQQVSDAAKIKEMIRQIEPGSTTNLNAGLMLGYKEATKYFSKESTNRVILLTDGIANRGVTDPKKIEEASQGFNDQGIDLSTIGVGLELNKDLLSGLAKSGRGLFHFVADSADIHKVFVSELQSLLSPVATEPNLLVKFGAGLELEKVYGYQPKTTNHSVSIKLDNMNSGMTEVVLLKFKRTGDHESSRINASLTYHDLEKNTEIEAAYQTALPLAVNVENGAGTDSSVTKNYTIAQLAQSIHDMAADCEKGRYQEAEGTVARSLEITHNRYPSLDDPDINRTVGIAEKYQNILVSQYGAGKEVDGPVEADRAARAVSENSVNLIQNGDFSKGNTGFSSDIEYAKPEFNVLWGDKYTIASTFNEPLLHSLLASEPSPAARKVTGREKVFYANLGDENLHTVYATVVKCRPNTLYHISFYAISLSGDGTPQHANASYIPNFTIQVAGAVSAVQSAGMGIYTKISFDWYSSSEKLVTVSIVKSPTGRTAGITGISNVEMTPETLKD